MCCFISISNNILRDKENVFVVLYSKIFYKMYHTEQIIEIYCRSFDGSIATWTYNWFCLRIQAVLQNKQTFYPNTAHGFQLRKG